MKAHPFADVPGVKKDNKISEEKEKWERRTSINPPV
jgi:hypothetical protein